MSRIIDDGMRFLEKVTSKFSPVNVYMLMQYEFWKILPWFT